LQHTNSCFAMVSNQSAWFSICPGCYSQASRIW